LEERLPANVVCQVDADILNGAGNGMDVPGGLEDDVGDICVAMYRDKTGQ
jgi:hypothetical protein